MNNGTNGSHKKLKKEPSKQQLKLVKALVDPKVKTITEAGKIAGYYDRKSAHVAMRSQAVQESLRDLIGELRACGIDQKLYAKKAKDGLDATHGKDNKPDFKERREMLALCYKLEGYLNQKDDNEDEAKKPPLVIIIGESGLDGII